MDGEEMVLELTGASGLQRRSSTLSLVPASREPSLLSPNTEDELERMTGWRRTDSIPEIARKAFSKDAEGVVAEGRRPGARTADDDSGGRVTSVDSGRLGDDESVFSMDDRRRRAEENEKRERLARMKQLLARSRAAREAREDEARQKVAEQHEVAGPRRLATPVYLGPEVQPEPVAVVKREEGSSSSSSDGFGDHGTDPEQEADESEGADGVHSSGSEDREVRPSGSLLPKPAATAELLSIGEIATSRDAEAPANKAPDISSERASHHEENSLLHWVPLDVRQSGGNLADELLEARLRCFFGFFETAAGGGIQADLRDPVDHLRVMEILEENRVLRERLKAFMEVTASLESLRREHDEALSKLADARALLGRSKEELERLRAVASDCRHEKTEMQMRLAEFLRKFIAV